MAVKTVLLIALLFSISLHVEGQIDLESLAGQAERFYQDGNAAGASHVYEAMIEAGAHDSAIYTNLGHAYFELQELGRALLNYRRAQLIQPRDNALSADLARIRSLRRDVQGDESAVVDSLAQLTSAVVTLQEMNWIMLVLWAGSFTLLSVFILRPRWRDLLRGPTILLFMLLTLGLILWGSRAYATYFRPAAVVVQAQASVLSGPGENYLALYDLYAAAEMRLLDRRNGWVRFVLPDQRQGWIEESAVEAV
jgi:hypothetical protein